MLDRRSFVKSAGSMGLGFSPGLVVCPGPLPQIPPARAKAVIQIFLDGGLSHIDSFDPKPFAPVEVRSEFKTIKSKSDGARFTELLRHTAGISDKIAVIRSMTHRDSDHDRGRHWMLTGSPPSPATICPSMGSVVALELGSRHNLPPYVAVPKAHDQFMGTGYLSAAFGPFGLFDEPNRHGFQVQDLRPPPGVDGKRLTRRKRFLKALDTRFAERAAADALDATDAFYDQAYALIDSPSARAAFAIEEEPAKLRDRYGRTTIGQRLLLARRLVQSGVRFVTVPQLGYDNHGSVARNVKRLLRPFDQGFAALITDLAATGLLAETLVMVVTEFGRTPLYNDAEGRNHWSSAFSIVLAGAGIQGGIIHGSTTEDGGEPASDPVSPADLAATVFTLLGVDPDKRLQTPGGRPQALVRDGKFLSSLLS